MKALPSPRRMQYVPRGRQLLDKESSRDVSQRTVCETRAGNPARTRCVPLAAPRPVERAQSRVGIAHQEPGALVSPRPATLSAGGTYAAGAPSGLLWY
jgi:hypothetical protein